MVIKLIFPQKFRGIIGAGVGSAVLKEGNPLGLQYVMFVPTLMGQGNPEQQAKWLQKAFECNIVGTYAQVSERNIQSKMCLTKLYLNLD